MNDICISLRATLYNQSNPINNMEKGDKDLIYSVIGKQQTIYEKKNIIFTTLTRFLFLYIQTRIQITSFSFLATWFFKI